MSIATEHPNILHSRSLFKWNPQLLFPKIATDSSLMVVNWKQFPFWQCLCLWRGCGFWWRLPLHNRSRWSVWQEQSVQYAAMRAGAPSLVSWHIRYWCFFSVHSKIWKFSKDIRLRGHIYAFLKEVNKLYLALKYFTELTELQLVLIVGTASLLWFMHLHFPDQFYLTGHCWICYWPSSNGESLTKLISSA